jgi:hypothetical protein
MGQPIKLPNGVTVYGRAQEKIELEALGVYYPGHPKYTKEKKPTQTSPTTPDSQGWSLSQWVEATGISERVMEGILEEYGFKVPSDMAAWAETNDLKDFTGVGKKTALSLAEWLSGY